jgi:hypothetical protein
MQREVALHARSGYAQVLTRNAALGARCPNPDPFKTRKDMQRKISSAQTYVRTGDLKPFT